MSYESISHVHNWIVVSNKREINTEAFYKAEKIWFSYSLSSPNLMSKMSVIFSAIQAFSASGGKQQQ